MAAIDAGKFVIIDELSNGEWRHKIWTLRGAKKGQVDYMSFVNDAEQLTASYDYDASVPQWEWDVQ